MVAAEMQAEAVMRQRQEQQIVVAEAEAVVEQTLPQAVVVLSLLTQDL
jgi:hypothetical protein